MHPLLPVLSAAASVLITFDYNNNPAWHSYVARSLKDPYAASCSAQGPSTH